MKTVLAVPIEGAKIDPTGRILSKSVKTINHPNMRVLQSMGYYSQIRKFSSVTMQPL